MIQCGILHTGAATRSIQKLSNIPFRSSHTFHSGAATRSIQKLSNIPFRSCHTFYSEAATHSIQELPNIPFRSCHTFHSGLHITRQSVAFLAAEARFLIV
ncbi:hypothetical protein AVEN_117751-1 [Araneus ventricosus]|uniref:Uncharacterized protein n=1 Tax=Araneus ventricosus TaxID=182803 RepID=A0A4Y2B804_ARAVE|nr:hypothetical protein AVEN_117751-1 [Araneus ventricosus]